MEITPLTTDTDNLPALTGSDKQVAWANDIRQAFIDEHSLATCDDIDVTYILRNATLDSLVEAVGPLADKPHLEWDYDPAADNAVVAKAEHSKITRGVEASLAQTEARWWIDRKSANIVAGSVVKTARAAQRQSR